jgi:hypothetical protein
VLVLDGGVEEYDPVPQASEIFTAALDLSPDEPASLMAFIQRWGHLAVGTGLSSEAASIDAKPNAFALTDTVWATRRALRELQRHFAWLRALQAREWRGPAVPALWDEIPPPPAAHGAGIDACLEAALELVPPPERPDFTKTSPIGWLQIAEITSPLGPDLAAFVRGHQLGWRARRVRPRDREQAHWSAFAAAITEYLRLVHPTMRWSGGHPTAAWRIRRLVDVLWIQLWNLATGGVCVRRCRHQRCRKWFPVDRQGKVYCSLECSHRGSAAASYQKSQRNRRRGKRR